MSTRGLWLTCLAVGRTVGKFRWLQQTSSGWLSTREHELCLPTLLKPIIAIFRCLTGILSSTKRKYIRKNIRTSADAHWFAQIPLSRNSTDRKCPYDLISSDEQFFGTYHFLKLCISSDFKTWLFAPLCGRSFQRILFYKIRVILIIKKS